MTTLADNFNRANGSVGTTNYTAPAGATLPNISSNVVVASSVSIQYVALLNGTWGNNQAITMDMTRGSSGSKISALMIRYADNGSTGYLFQLVGSGTTATLSRVDAGVATQIDSASVTGGGTFTLSAIGDTIKVEQTGVGTIMEVTDATYGSGRPGYLIFRSGSGSTGTLDNLSATDELGGELFDETGRLVTASATVSVSDALVSNESPAVSAAATVSSSDTAQLNESVDVSATATVAVNDTQEGGAETPGVSVTATVTVSDTQNHNESVSVTGSTTVATGDSKGMTEATLVEIVGDIHVSDSISGSGLPPDPPTVVRPTSPFGYDGEVELTWGVPSDNGSAITGYVVQVSTNDGDSWMTHDTVAGTPATLTGLTLGQRYMFRVAAVNSGGTGPWAVSEWGCTPVSASGPLTPPTATTRDASHTGRWGLDEVDGTTDNLSTSTWTGEGIRVYIVDSNFRLTHDEFAAQAFTEGYAIDGLTLGSLAYDEDHGTKIASVCVGLTCGLAYDAIMIPVASHNQSVTTPIYNFVEALQWVYDNHPANTPGIVVTSNLWGDDNDAPGFTDTDGRHTDDWFPMVDQLVTDLIEQKGMAFVQCIGNSDSTAHIDLAARPGLVLVSYSNEANQYASGSEFSPDTTIIAPGSAVLTAQRTGDSAYVLQSGTSFAAPLTGGAMACWLEANPRLTPRQLVDILLEASAKGVLTGENSGAPNRELRSLTDIASTSIQLSESVVVTGTATVSVSSSQASAESVETSAAATVTVYDRRTLVESVSVPAAMAVTATDQVSQNEHASVSTVAAVTVNDSARIEESVVVSISSTVTADESALLTEHVSVEVAATVTAGDAISEMLEHVAVTGFTAVAVTDTLRREEHAFVTIAGAVATSGVAQFNEHPEVAVSATVSVDDLFSGAGEHPLVGVAAVVIVSDAQQHNESVTVTSATAVAAEDSIRAAEHTELTIFSNVTADDTLAGLSETPVITSTATVSVSDSIRASESLTVEVSSQTEVSGTAQLNESTTVVGFTSVAAEDVVIMAESILVEAAIQISLEEIVQRSEHLTVVAESYVETSSTMQASETVTVTVVAGTLVDDTYVYGTLHGYWRGQVVSAIYLNGEQVLDIR